MSSYSLESENGRKIVDAEWIDDSSEIKKRATMNYD